MMNVEEKPTSNRGPGSNPLRLAASAFISLLVFAGIGGGLRSLRQGDEPREVSRQEAASEALAPHPPQSRGRLVFQVHCARCHGAEGHGDGPDAATLRPPPRDLRGLAWRTPPSRDSIRKTVAEGLPNSMMPGLAASLSSTELNAVVDYVLSIAPKERGGVGPSSAADLSALLTKAGFAPAAASRMAPAFLVRGVGGESVALEHLRGKLVVLGFWGTRCAPCLEELPELERLVSRFGRESLSVVPVCADEDDPTVVRRVAGELVPKLSVFTDPSGVARLSYDVQALPTAVLIDANGHLLGQAAGVTHWSSPEVETLIRTSLSGIGRPEPETKAEARSD